MGSTREAHSRGTYNLPLRSSWQEEGSQCSEIGHSLGILARARGGALSPACPLGLLLRSGGDRGLRRSETFCGSVCASDPQKVPGALMDPLADALRRTPKWLKSSVERPSDKSLWRPWAAALSGTKGAETALP